MEEKEKTLASRVYKELQSPFYLKPGVTFTAVTIAKAIDRPGVTARTCASTLHRLVAIGDTERVGDTFPFTYKLLKKPTVIEKARPVHTGPRKTKAFLARQEEIRKVAADWNEAPKAVEIDKLPEPEPSSTTVLSEPMDQTDTDELERLFGLIRDLTGSRLIDLSTISTPVLMAEVSRRLSK